MWFEGITTPKEFFGVLRDAITSATVPVTNEDGTISQVAPWTMVSSNVGSTTADDGYVFHSKGSSGKDSLFLGFTNAYHSSWNVGPQFFVAENYDPSTIADTNGVFTNRLHESFWLHETTSWGGATEDKMPLKYFISVNADRVIIGAMNVGFSHDPVRYRPLIYLGLMKRYSEERDSGAALIASTNGDVQNSYNWFRVLKDPRGNQNVRYMVETEPIQSSFLPSYGTHNFQAFPIPIYNTLGIEGVRGEMDGMLIVRHASTSVGRNMIRDGKVMVNGEEYQALTKLYYSQSKHNNFGPSTTDYTLLIKKA